MNYLVIISGFAGTHNANARGRFHELVDAEEWAQRRANKTGQPAQILRLPGQSFVKGILPREKKPEQRRKSKGDYPLTTCNNL